ncbi:MAG: DNA-processing protein DprA [Alphaproteobacteria bacterium]|nr:DNA-processing protein DprA [Alphaproteobacteria bacterium]
MLSDIVIDWFALISSQGIGPKTFWALMRRYRTAAEAIKHIEKPFNRLKAEKILNSMNCNVILANDQMFPKSLRRTCSCPPLLFYKGDISIINKRKIAIIGARNASLTGKSIAKNLAENLSRYFAIVSGLAKGIDTSAHIGSLENPSYKSAISVLPMSFDNIYPKENQKLFEKIAENGLVITEKPYGSHNEQGSFHARNRIVTLLSEAIIVIEAAAKSGTMTTAQMALDIGCEVLVVPGSPSDPRNFGSNLLIRNGATLIQSYEDVLESLNYVQQEHISVVQHKVIEEAQSINQSDLQNKILEMLSNVPVTLDELSFQLKVPMQDILCAISELELKNMIARHSSNGIVLGYK